MERLTWEVEAVIPHFWPLALHEIAWNHRRHHRGLLTRSRWSDRFTGGRAPYDPDLGPTASNGRTVVYARGGDLYRFDVGSTAERKLTRLSSSATERAPSFYKESITFSRAGSRPGWYLYRPGKALKRLSKAAPLETDIAATRVAGRFFGGARSVIRQSNFTGADLRTIARAHAGEKLSSPTLTRFNVFWLRDLARSRAARAERVGLNAHRGLRPLTADHAFSSATSLATTLT